MEEPSKILQTLRLNSNEITCCDINGNYLLAVGSSDRTLRVLEWKTALGFVDLFYSPLPPFKYGVSSVRFSAKGVMLVSSSVDGTAIINNVQTGSKVFSINQPNSSSIKFCDFSADSSKLVTGGEDGVFCFWDLIHQNLIRKCKLHENEFTLRDFSLSLDSEYLVSGDSEGFLMLWYMGAVDKRNPECLLKQRNVHGGIFSCDFSPNVEIIEGIEIPKLKYQFATCGYDCLISIWCVTIAKSKKDQDNLFVFKCDVVKRQILSGHVGDVISVKFSSTGEYLSSTGMDSTVKLWHILTGSHIKTLIGHKRFVTCSAFSKDSIILATGSNDKTVIIWDLNQNLSLDTQIIKPCNICSHFSNTDLLSIFNSKEHYSSTKLYTRYNFSMSQKLMFTAPVNSLQFSGNEVLALGNGDKTLTIWEERLNKFVRKESEALCNLKYNIDHLDISCCGEKIISCSKSSDILLWDLKLGITYEMKTPICNKSLRTCRFSPDSKLIAAAGDDQKVYLWDANTLEFIRAIQSHGDSITSIAFTPDSELLLSTSCSGEILVYSVLKNNSLSLINAHDLGVTSCDISLSTVSKSEDIEICSTDISYNDNYLLATCGNDSFVKLWQVKSSEIQILKTLSGHGSTVNCVRFSIHESFILASCSTDSTVRIWNANLGHCLQVLNVHQNAVTSCSFSQDSSLLATGSLDKTVLIWKLKKQMNMETKDILQSCGKPIQNWSNEDVANWFESLNSEVVAGKIRSTFLNGWKIMTAKDSANLGLNFKNAHEQNLFELHLSWLKKEANWKSYTDMLNLAQIPHKFTCPLTHEIMKDPVTCEDGYSYERQAILEWFLSGNFTSPMTKEYLKSSRLVPNFNLKTQICNFLFQNDKRK